MQDRGTTSGHKTTASAAALREPLVPAFPVEGTRPGAVLGHLDGVDAEGRILFRPEGGQEAVPVAVAAGVSDEELVRAAWTGRRALAVEAAGAPPRLVLAGFVRERVSAQAREAWPSGICARLDGRTVRLEAAERIELVVGRSRIVLDALGRIEVNGSYLLSRSRGPVKIKGATVEIN